MARIICPQIPVALQNGLPPPGSAVWCAWIDELRDFVSSLGEAVGRWIDSNLDYKKWRNALNEYRNALLAEQGVFIKSWVNILGALLDIIDIGIIGADVVKDLVACAWHWHKVVLPAQNPAAYIGCVIVRNILRSIKSSAAGPEWVAKITITAVIEIPALEDAISHLMDYLLPMEMPTTGEATAAWSHGLIDTAARDCVWKYWGHAPSGYEPYATAQTAAIGPQQAIEISRRLGNVDAFTEELLKRAGYIDDRQRRYLKTLYDRLPSEQLYLQSARNRTMDDGFVQEYGLANGFEDGYWSSFRDNLEAQGVTKEVAYRNYVSHWNTLSLGQIAEMAYRLRPDNPQVKKPFSDHDWQRHAAMLGYTPKQAEWLYELLPRQLSVSEARGLYYRGLATEQDVRASLFNAGYTDLAVEQQLSQERIAINQWRARTYGGWTPQSAGKAFAIGQITHNQLASIMGPLGGTNQDIAALEQRSVADYQYRILNRAKSRLLTSTISQVKQAIRVGVMDTQHAVTALEAVGWPAQQAQGIAAIESAAAKVDRVRHAVAHIRTALLNGEVTLLFAEESLKTLGIVPAAIASYVATWKVENTPNRKRRNAQQIVADMSEGLLSVEDATGRLTNLGYNHSDIQLYIADAERKMYSNAPAVAAAKSAANSTASGAKAAAHTYLPGLSKRAIGELMAQETPAMLKGYLKHGVISEEYTRNRLQLYNWQEEAIDALIQEALKQPAGKHGTQAATTDSGSQSGSGAGPTP